MQLHSDEIAAFSFPGTGILVGLRREYVTKTKYTGLRATYTCWDLLKKTLVGRLAFENKRELGSCAPGSIYNARSQARTTLFPIVMTDQPDGPVLGKM
jgi:hypothetical protein